MSRPLRQPPLIDLGSTLPSPLFTPRPGWGGKFRIWLGENGALTLFRILVIVASLLILKSLAGSWASPRNLAALPLLTVSSDVHSETAQRGEGMIALATRAIDECLAEHPDLGSLDPIEHLWAVNRLWRTTPAQPISPGVTIDFPHDAVASIIDAAKHISPITRQSLAPYIR